MEGCAPSQPNKKRKLFWEHQVICAREMEGLCSVAADQKRFPVSTERNPAFVLSELLSIAYDISIRKMAIRHRFLQRRDRFKRVINSGLVDIVPLRDPTSCGGLDILVDIRYIMRRCVNNPKNGRFCVYDVNIAVA